MGSGIFTFLCFSLIRNVSKQLKVWTDIFSLFQYVSVVYYIIYMFQCFETPEYGVWNFHLFMFQFVSKRFETIESVDLDIFSLFQYVSVSLLYNLYVSMFRNTRIWGLEFSPFFVSVCFETFRNN